MRKRLGLLVFFDVVVLLYIYKILKFKPNKNKETRGGSGRR